MAFYRCGGGADVSLVTATPEYVYIGKKYVNSEGDLVEGTMPDGSATVSGTLAPNALSLSTGSFTGSVYRVVVSNSNKTHSVTPTVVAGKISTGTAGSIIISGVSANVDIPAYDWEG